MKKGRITTNQLRELVRLYNGLNFVKFELTCKQYGIDRLNMFNLLCVMRSFKIDAAKYGIDVDDLKCIDINFLYEGVSMGDEPVVKRLVKKYKITVCKLHEIYAKWYLTGFEMTRLVDDEPGKADLFGKGEWFDELCSVIGKDKVDEIFEFNE